MKVTLTHGDKTVELDLTAEQMEQLGLKEEKKKTGYEKVEKGEMYFFSDGNDCIDHVRVGSYLDQISGNDNIDKYENANYYSDIHVAANNVRADRLMRNLRRYAAEHGGIPSLDEWRNSKLHKYYIYFVYSEKVDVGISYCTTVSYRETGNVYFRSEEACKAAIEEFRGELIWYFTEYQAMLY